MRNPIPDFAAEVEHLYIGQDRLGSALKAAQDLIAISEASGAVTNEELAEEDKWDEGDGVGRLTKGALIPLKVRRPACTPSLATARLTRLTRARALAISLSQRTVAGLEKIWAERETRPKP